MERHVHVSLDEYGYCRGCGVRVLFHFRGIPLPDRPADPPIARRRQDDALAAELSRQAESDRLVEEFVAEGDRDPDSVAAKVYAELGRFGPAEGSTR